MSDSYVIQCLVEIYDRRSSISLHSEVVNVVFYRSTMCFLPDNVWGTRFGMKRYTSHDDIAFAVKSMTTVKVLSYDRKNFVGTPEQRRLMFGLKKALRSDGWAAVDCCVISTRQFPPQMTIACLQKLTAPETTVQPKVSVWEGTLPRTQPKHSRATLRFLCDETVA